MTTASSASVHGPHVALASAAFALLVVSVATVDNVGMVSGRSFGSRFEDEHR